MKSGPKISVIIPALNEEDNIAKSIMSILEGNDKRSVEVIVSDGGSADRTRSIGELMGAQILITARGRGFQMDSAAEGARGDILLFLHADTVLERGWYEAIRRCMEDKGAVGGAFTFSVDSKKKRFRLLERLVDIRAKRFGLIYGDQAVFARKGAFFRAGGFKKLPLMEDVDCVNRLRRLGRFVLLEEKVITSGRRWGKEGVLTAAVKNWLFLLLYCLGVSPQTLCRWYYGAGVMARGPG